MSELPSVSVVIPTLNSEATLERCLDAIRAQDYPHERMEIIICDGMSADGTRRIAKARSVDRILENPLKTGEAGKAVGWKAARNELVAFIDSDNFLIGTDWLRRMAAPFLKDPELVLTEPVHFHWDPASPAITRYCALMGLNDPLCYYTGNFDRWNAVTRSWTGLEIPIHDEGDWFWFERTAEDPLPTIGANGTVYRRSVLEGLPSSDYFFDVDVPHRLLALAPRRFAKVRTGILHWYCPALRDFTRKQKRRIGDYWHHWQQQDRTGHSHSYRRGGIGLFILATLLIVPCLITSFAGYRRKPDSAWFLHWPLSALTLWIYASMTIRFGFRSTPPDRTQWQAPAGE
jgi:glycosyltransferase involved in cell wall biosynthesis